MSDRTALALAQANQKAKEVASLMQEFKGQTDALQFECEGLQQLLHHHHHNHNAISDPVPWARGHGFLDADAAIRRTLMSASTSSSVQLLSLNESRSALQSGHGMQPLLEDSQERLQQAFSEAQTYVHPVAWRERESELVSELAAKHAEVKQLRAREGELLAALTEAEQKFGLLIERDEAERKELSRLYDEQRAEKSRFQVIEEVTAAPPCRMACCVLPWSPAFALLLRSCCEIA